MKTCSKCHIEKSLSIDFYTFRTKKGTKYPDRVCITCRLIQCREEYQKNKEVILEKIHQKRLSDPEGERKKDKIRFRKVKVEVMMAYGKGKEPVCACCGETELNFLSIDHINNDGAALRKNKKQGASGISFYYWLRRNNYPLSLQVLCFNCNLAKGFFGRCPHEDYYKSKNK